MKNLATAYSYNPTAKTITLTALNVPLSYLLLVVNATRGTIIYNLADPALAAANFVQAANSVLTLNASVDTSFHNAADDLTIFYDDGVQTNTLLIQGPAGPKGDDGEPGSTTWAGITDKPATFAPSAHKSTHATGGSDALTPAAIGAAPAIASSNIVSGDFATVAGGIINQSTGVGAFVGGGNNHLASGINSVVVGGHNNHATGIFGTVLGGIHARADKWSQQAHAGGNFAVPGDNQRSRFVTRCFTTNDAPVEFFLDGSAERLTLANDRAIAFTIQIVASLQGHSENASFLRKGLIVNDGGVTSIVGAVEAIGTDQKSAGAAPLAVSITADVANNSLKIEATGIATQNWRWFASIDAAEVSFP